ncbi:ROK family protein [Thiolapillus sp.]|uniref:ROK family protein n=1 Tax=Thiolapillus sp. TaxID=2017437 RepID=UPI0025F7A34C
MLAGMDLGGSKIEALLMDQEGDELLCIRQPTPTGDYDATLQAIHNLHHELESHADRQLKLGIGTPGSPSPETGLMRNANSTCLNGQPLQQDLEQLLERPVRMANDADCFTLSEAVDGAASDADIVFGVNIGTGTGGGICVHGKLLLGPNAITGEWGHNPLPWPRPEELPGPACYCGKHGCIETFLSGPGLAGEHLRRTGKTLMAPEIAALAAQGDAAAETTLQIYEDRLARGLASIINVLDPHAIVLGGGLSQLQRLYDNVSQRWQQYIFSDIFHTRLLPPRFGDSSGVRGAAWLWRDQP